MMSETFLNVENIAYSIVNYDRIRKSCGLTVMSKFKYGSWSLPLTLVTFNMLTQVVALCKQCRIALDMASRNWYFICQLVPLLMTFERPVNV